jgi:hypothetical protein
LQAAAPCADVSTGRPLGLTGDAYCNRCGDHLDPPRCRCRGLDDVLRAHENGDAIAVPDENPIQQEAFNYGLFSVES